MSAAAAGRIRAHVRDLCAEHVRAEVQQYLLAAIRGEEDDTAALEAAVNRVITATGGREKLASSVRGAAWASRDEAKVAASAIRAAVAAGDAWYAVIELRRATGILGRIEGSVALMAAEEVAARIREWAASPPETIRIVDDDEVGDALRALADVRQAIAGDSPDKGLGALALLASMRAGDGATP